MFFDEARVHVRAGKGGDGVVSFRREKYVPFGGPNGGRGGKGGDVYFEVDPGLNTLIRFKERPKWIAPDGARGRGKDQTGAAGEDVVVMVPPGTMVYDEEADDLLADLTTAGQRALIVRGGRGGRGNAAFATSTNQAPRIAERGEPGEERRLRLELKLIADVGIVGMPNAGKSTLLSVISAARPKIADYPFTTLQPNLGVVTVDDHSFVAADIPGLIEGAHAGSGLGHQFLRHIERTRLLIHLVDGLSQDPLRDYEIIDDELACFNPRLAQKPQLVVLNKLDLPDVRGKWPALKSAWKQRGHDPLAISAVTGENVNGMLRVIIRTLAELPAEREEPPEPAVIHPVEDPKRFEIEREASGWRVRGGEIERAAAMTRWDLHESVMRFQRILEALGVSQSLEEAGVQRGDVVRIGETELEWGW